MKWENVLLLPFFGFIQWPLAALLPASLFGLGYCFNRKPFIAGAAAMWVLYGIYEFLMKARVLCTGECNIRVDLLLIVPALWIVSIVAAIKFFRKSKVPNGPA